MKAPIDLQSNDTLNVLYTQGDYNLVSIERDGRIIWRGGVMSDEGTAMEGRTKHQLRGGTTRSEKAPPYHLVPAVGPRRIAHRFGLGADTHGENNWKKSIHDSEESAAAFCKEAYNHMIEHAMKMNRPFMDTEAGNLDDDLGAIGWAVCVLCYAEEVWGKPWGTLRS